MTPPELTERFTDALAYAAEVHAGDVRKGSEVPYVSHVLAVCALVLEDGGDEDEAIAALLHDAGEDAGGRERIEEIRERFGDRVARIVEECSDTLETPKPPWRERKEAYLAHLAESSSEAIRVSLADKLHNARAIERDYRALGEELWTRFNGGREGTLWYYRALADEFARLSESPMVGELERTLSDLEDDARAQA